MKLNLPITNNEVLLTENSSIVSKTDLKGRITYINREFIEISGFVESELIGKSHNIVRHPDMPPEAFKDLWTTVKAGKPWNGIVKNRCKNGDYYWVEANVAPVRESGKVIGYMSVRSKATSQQIEEAESIYARAKQGEHNLQKNFIDRISNKIHSLPLIFKMGSAVFTPIIIMLGYLSIQKAQVDLSKIAFASVLISGISVFLLNGFISNSLAKINGAVNAIAEGDFKYAIDTRVNDEIGKVMQLIKTMQIRVGFDVNDARKNQEEASKLQAAIENSTTAFSFSDSQNRISYMNNAAKAIWSKVIDQVKTKHPDFNQESMVGTPIADYFEHDEDKLLFSNSIKSPKTIELSMYSLALKLNVVPVYTDSNEYLGYMIQWQDVTAELAAEKEVIRLVNEAVEGNLSERVDTNILPEGFIKDIGTGINQILKAVIDPLNMAASYVEKISKGEIPEKITDDYKGDFSAIRNNLNQCVDAVNTLIEDASMLSQAAIKGELSTRADIERHQGDFRKIVEGVNATLDSVIAPLNLTAQYISDISKGNIPPKITDDFHGDFNTIKNNLNTCVDAVNRLIQDANMLADAAKEGRITARVDASNHQGDYSNIVNGMNKTLDIILAPIITVKEAVEAITGAANEISTGNSDLSIRTEKQASNLEETAASIDELSSTVKLNSENAQRANELAVAASDVANKGGEIVNEVVNTMSDINQSAQKIEEIISIIDGLAFQTNILALNAAVEAARAGEQGKGFAVVAGEVRSLAQRSASAAKEIETLITESVSKTNEGSKLVEVAGETMGEVVQSVQQVSEIIAEISTSSRQQSNGINQVNEAVTDMDETTQQNSALVEQAAAAAESLEEQTVALADVVNTFKLQDEKLIQRKSFASEKPKLVSVA